MKGARYLPGSGHPVPQRGAFFLRALILGLFALLAVPAFAQRERGQIQLQVHDPKGGALQATVVVSSDLNQVSRSFQTDATGKYSVRDLPFGLYQVKVSHQGFIPVQRLIEVRSEVPVSLSLTLSLAPVESTVHVTASDTLIDPERATALYSVGAKSLQEQIPAQMGRGVTDAVASQPGWVYEANGVLHPRGSEYDVQYVMNGLPLTENRSLAYAPPVESEDVQSLRVMTAGFPAEYGRKMGGIVEVTTNRQIPPGLHVNSTIQGGSFGSLGGNLQLGYARGRNQFTITGHGGFTDRYLDPPVLANYTNHGSTAGFSASYSRNLSQSKQLQLSFSRSEVHYMVPNELVQQEAGQRQDVGDTEVSGKFDYEQVLSPTLLFSAEGSVRDDSFTLTSNAFSTPVIIHQNRGFRQGYGRITLSGSHGMHDWKAGTDIIVNPVHETLQYTITNPSLFDPNTNLNFQFADQKTAIEPAAFVQDTMHFKNWNVSLGIRYDRYNFLVSKSAWSPRIAVSYYFPHAGLLIHADYDRVFQTPATENLLLASSPQLNQVNSLVLRLPVPPSYGNYYEVGFTKGLWKQLRFDANFYRRRFKNYSDDDTLLNTGVSFPISFAGAWINGIEAMLTMPHWGRFSGSISYAYQEGFAWGPITGGLFIGSEAVSGVAENTRFPDTQDQRNTGSARLRVQVTDKLWVATQQTYGSGLPTELEDGDTYSYLLSQYGPQVLQQVNFQRGRVRPSYSIDFGAGYDIYNKEDKTVSLQFQGSNLTDHLNVINFAGLFSGTAIGPPRSFSAGLKVSF